MTYSLPAGPGSFVRTLARQQESGGGEAEAWRSFNRLVDWPKAGKHRGQPLLWVDSTSRKLALLSGFV
jgi:hypothetical protein